METDLKQEVRRLEKELAATETLWRQERARVRELEAQRDEMESVLTQIKGGKHD